MALDALKCEGMRRYGGVMSLGPPRWAPCDGTPIVRITVDQGEGPENPMPACRKCWEECRNSKEIKLLDVEPL